MFFRHPLQQAIRKKLRIERAWTRKDGSTASKPKVFYPCDICKQEFQGKYMNVDHKEPVVSIEDGFIDWNTYVLRLFCDVNNLRLVCKTCHAAKTSTERGERVRANRARAQKNV